MGSATWSRPGRVWLVIGLLAAAPRLYFAIGSPLAFDEYWHVFVARQDTREALALEWRLTVHPPLYYWLLKLALTLGSTRLVYRLVSLAAGIVAVFVIGRIVLQLTQEPVLSYLAALTFALAPPAVIASFEVRAYMLSTCFMLAAFSLYLSILATPSRTGVFCFSSLCCLALASSYSAFFFVFACMVSLLYVSANGWARGTVPGVVRALPGPLVLGIALPAVTMAILYREHVRGIARVQGQIGHLPAFYYQPTTGESILEYVVRALHNEYNIFLPVPIGAAAALPLLVFTAIVFSASLVYLLSRSREVSRRLPCLFVILLAGGMLAASVVGVYPFGGLLRQQFILFPFLVTAGFVVVNGVVSRWPHLKIPAAALALTLGCLGGISHLWSIPRAEVCSRQMTIYRESFDTPPLVYTDPVGLMPFFAHHDRWQWRAGPRGLRGGHLDRYELHKDGQVMIVVRERWRTIDLDDERTYQDLAWSLRSLGLDSATMFVLTTRIPSFGPHGETQAGLCENEEARPEDRPGRRQRIVSLAAAQHLEASRLIFVGPDFFGAFKVKN